jgi:two-component system LytT family response regulator
MDEKKDKINVLIVDDEKNACINIVNLLIEFIGPEVSITGIAHNTDDAFKLINDHKPDCLFLDIEMPGENAFEFLERISPVDFEVVFITAYDQYAVRAFRLNAVDYILKPVAVSQLKNAVEKIKERLTFNKVVGGKVAYTKLAEQIKSRQKINTITFKNTNSAEVVNFRDIYFIEAHSSYSKIVFVKKGEVRVITMSYPLSDYEELLPTHMFYRVHRSYLVNCLHIENVSNDESQQLAINNGMMVPVSRRKYASLIQFMKDNNYL